MKKRTDWKTGLLIILAAVLCFTLIDNFVLKKQLDVIRDREAYATEQIAAVTVERNLIADTLQLLKAEYRKIYEMNSLKETQYVSLQKRLEQLQYENSVLLAHMLEVPEDTAYAELQLVYPTAEDLRFPFSGEQVKWLWHDVSALTLKEYEMGVQKELLLKCNAVTLGKADMIGNLEHQNSLLTESNSLAGEQISALGGQLAVSSAEAKRKTWWNRVLGAVTMGLATYVIVDVAGKQGTITVLFLVVEQV